MPILFSAVALGRNITAKYASCDGNFTEIVEEVLLRIPWNNHKMTYFHGRYLFHYVVEDDRCYFCITDKRCQRTRAFLFLNQMRRRYSPKERAFERVLAEEMRRYSEDYSTIAVAKGELDMVNGIGVECSERILGEKILIVNNPEEIAFSTVSHGKSPQQIEDLYETAGDRSESRLTCKSCLVILTVILVLMWLVLSRGPTTLLVLACVVVVLIETFKRDEKSS